MEYAKNIQSMIQSASDKQSELLNVINDLFIFVEDPYSDKKKIRINPKLNEDGLQKIVEKTRNIIIELYVKCELDYVNNLKVYEAIVESKILETTKKQIENLEKKSTAIVNETNKQIREPKFAPYYSVMPASYVPPVTPLNVVTTAPVVSAPTTMPSIPLNVQQPNPIVVSENAIPPRIN
jgi:hypothetical protein